VQVLANVDPRLPHILLAAFLQDGSADNDVHLHRWRTARELCAANGMLVVNHGADGDPPQLRAMTRRFRFYPAQRSADGSARPFTLKGVPGRTGATDLSVLSWRAVLGDDRELFVPRLQHQDFFHLLNKLVYVGAIYRSACVCHRRTERG
jgi:hypothetical protein